MIRQVSYLALIILVLAKCSTDVELEGPANPIPVVYGILEANDSAHYLRIEKVFQSEGGNAEQLARDPLNFYYDENEIAVLLRKNSGLEATLDRVDGNAEGLIREDGPFASSPNILYKIKANDFRLDGGEKINLELSFSDNTQAVTAETIILEPVIISNSSPPTAVNMSYERTIRTSWSSGEAAALHGLEWIIIYRERTVPGNWEEKRLSWRISDRIEDTPGASLETVTFKGRQFYDFLASNLEAAANIQREFLGFEVKVVSMGNEFADILQLSNANIGITSTQFDPIYSNVEGGIGVLTSRSSAIRTGIVLNPISIDSLKNGIITGALNF